MAAILLSIIIIMFIAKEDILFKNKLLWDIIRSWKVQRS